MTPDIGMDVGEYERGVHQSIAQLETMVETTAEAIDIVDLSDLEQDLCRLSRIIGFVAEEREKAKWRQARAREAA